MSRIVFPYRYNHQVMKHACEGHVIIDDFRELALHQREINSFDSLAHPAVFLRRLADDDRLVDRLLAMSNAGNVKDRELVFERGGARMIAERAFGSKLFRIYIAFDYDLGVSWNLDVHSFTLNHLDRFLAQKAGDHHLIEIFRQRHNCRKDCHRIGPQSHSYVEPPSSCSL